MTPTSPTPAGASSTSAGPASIHERLRALADEWNTLAAELPRAAEALPADVDETTRAHLIGRARQLDDCALDLRTALEEM